MPPPKTDVKATKKDANTTSTRTHVIKSQASSKKPLSPDQKRLLARQQELLKKIQNNNSTEPAREASVKLSPAKTREIAHKVGIWNANGKLSSNYKK